MTCAHTVGICMHTLFTLMHTFLFFALLISRTSFVSGPLSGFCRYPTGGLTAWKCIVTGFEEWIERMSLPLFNSQLLKRSLDLTFLLLDLDQFQW